MTYTLEQLDRLCAEKILGLEIRHTPSPVESVYSSGICVGAVGSPSHRRYSPTRDISQAFDLLERLVEQDFVFNIDYLGKKYDESTRYEVWVCPSPLDCQFVNGRDLSSTIVRACLRAKGIEC